MPHNNFCYEFENYRLDITQRVLTREGEAIPLTPKATDVLLILLHNAGQLVARDSLISEVWPDAFVEEANLTQNIFLLRRKLQSDGPGRRFIETVARRGYRFVAPVKKVYAKVDHEEVLESPRRERQIPILAVLPFANATGNIDLQYLAEGIPESIINSLSSLSQIRVISRSTTFRYKNREFDPQTVGKKFGADALLIGKISLRDSVVAVGVELVSVENGWQLWGQTFDVDSENIFAIHDQITQHISRALKLPLSHEDEKRVAKRYTENAAAYQAYLEGRYHWSRYTREGIEKAISHFGRAIDLDPNYALAYAGIVDCYLRLATNYLPPEDDFPTTDDGEFEHENGSSIAAVAPATGSEEFASSQGGASPVGPAASALTQEKVLTHEKVKLRHEWDWKGAERELRRANELKTDYPAAHQWHAAYKFARNLLHERSADTYSPTTRDSGATIDSAAMARQVSSLEVTASERVQVFCAVAREQIDAGNYDGACDVLKPWWKWGEYPRLSGLRPETCGDLLLTAGVLAGCVASSRQLPQGQKHGEELLNGAIALFESLEASARSAEARIELALYYYREGLFDLARRTFRATLSTLTDDDRELRSLCLIRLASLERHAGRPSEALSRLEPAQQSALFSGPWATGRCHLEFASTFKDLAESEESPKYYGPALKHYQAALREFEAIGNHRLFAITQNNVGYMLVSLKAFKKAETHLIRAQHIFASLKDRVLGAQVNDSLAQLYAAAGQLELAWAVSTEAVNVLEEGDHNALLASSLTTKGTIIYSMNRHREGKSIIERAYRIAERCGDLEGAGRALLVIAEVMLDSCDSEECTELRFRLSSLLGTGRLPSIHNRLENALRAVSVRTQLKY